MTSSAAEQGQAPAQVSRIRETPVAIVGMSCLMPDARSLPEFWEDILDKIDSIVDQILEAFKQQFPNTFPGSLSNVVADRIANRLHIGGMNATTDACASALSAVRMAVHELLEGHNDVMLTGGGCTGNSVFCDMSFSTTPAFSMDPRCKPFDQCSQGTLVGEGIAMIAVERLPDAERDGNRIYVLVFGRPQEAATVDPPGGGRAAPARARSASAGPTSTWSSKSTARAPRGRFGRRRPATGGAVRC